MARSTQSMPGNREQIASARVFRWVLELAERQWGVLAHWQLWRSERLVVELDGGLAHGTVAQAARDRDRDLALRTAGYSVLRYSWRQITRDRRAVAADIRRALQRDS